MNEMVQKQFIKCKEQHEPFHAIFGMTEKKYFNLRQHNENLFVKISVLRLQEDTVKRHL